MIKISLLVCVFFAVFCNGNSQQQLNFGTFFGGCPEVTPTPRSVFEDSEGEWYTHRVGGLSPWKYVRCQSSNFDFKSGDDKSATVNTKFAFPILPIIFQIGGTVEKLNGGEYSFNYRNLVLGDMSQKATVLLNYGNAVLVYTCMDFKLFHLDSVQIMSRFKTSTTTNNNDGAITSALNGARRFGVSPGSFVEIDQSC